MLETISFRGWRGGPGGDAIDIELSGGTSETLKEAAEALKTQLARYGEVSALEDSLSYDKEELVLELTPQGQALGLTIDALGQTLRARLNVGGWLSPVPDLIPDSIGWLFLKTGVFMWMFLWFRATFPRYRYDQIMRLGWKVLIPVTIVWLVVEGVMVYFKVGPWFA